MSCCETSEKQVIQPAKKALIQEEALAEKRALILLKEAKVAKEAVVKKKGVKVLPQIEVGSGLHVEITPGVKVRLCGSDVWSFDKTFEMGDTVEYDSYNLSYHGVIIKITAKRITVDPGHGEAKKRMRFEEFIRRNWNFDLVKSCKENAITSNYL